MIRPMRYSLPLFLPPFSFLPPFLPALAAISFPLLSASLCLFLSVFLPPSLPLSLPLVLPPPLPPSPPPPPPPHSVSSPCPGLPLREADNDQVIVKARDHMI